MARYAVPFADPYLLPIAGLLTAVGLTEIYRLNPDDSFRQGIWIVVAVGLFSLTLFLLARDYRRLESYKYLFGLGAVALLVLLETRDLGGGLLYFGIFLAMLYVATARVAYVAAGIGLFIVGAIGVWKVTPHVQERVTIWRHPWTEHKVYCPQSGQMDLRQHCQSYQLVKSLYSIGHGQYAGTGLGKGTFTTISGKPIIPSLNTDFIYSALAQELGLIGAAALLLVYMIFVLRGIRISLLAQDGFSKLAAAGLTFGFALQTFIIVGGILRLIPLTGITLPFVSYGGVGTAANLSLLPRRPLLSPPATEPPAS